MFAPRCSSCGNAMHAIQYTALIIRTHPEDDVQS